MLLSVLYVMTFALSGVYIAEVLFPARKPLQRIWLGLVFGLFLWIWLPALLALMMGFTLQVQLISWLLVLAMGVFCGIRARWRIRQLGHVRHAKLWPLLLLAGIFVLGGSLFSTHILRANAQGYWVGQSTYGDLPMHLGFITSIAAQGTFPPGYSILAGHAVNYPFLCETPASTLLLLGSSLRQAYLVSALYAYALVILGVYFFFEQWLKRRGSTVLATLLFFFGSGFGFVYFIDMFNGGSTALARVLGSAGGGNNLQNLLDGFYLTPTNLPALGLRWVNPIVDMLIPQRATLFGWAFLFPCLYLLMGWAFNGEKRNLLPLAVLAGGLPLIHTHSFLALGIISASYFALELLREFRLKRFWGWLSYGAATLLLALPQLIFFTFAQISESGMMRFHFNWGNEIDSYLWFYLKNLGWLFVLAVPALLYLSKRDRRIMAGPLVIWVVSELIVFQPNTYDNNKLLFVSFAFLCGLVARFVSSVYRRISFSIEKREAPADSRRSYAQASALISFALFLYWLIKLLRVAAGAAIQLQFGACFTLLFLLFIQMWLLIRAGYGQLTGGKHRQLLLNAVSSILSLTLSILLLKRISEQYQQDALSVSRGAARFYILLMAATVLTQVIVLHLNPPRVPHARHRAKLSLSLCCCLLALTTFLSSAMTLTREVRSNYLAFEPDEIAAAEHIKENTAADAVFLTDANWHFNAVASLTGRNIVCGADIFLYFHGVDAREQRRDVSRMLEEPAENLALFENYGVDYVYIGQRERDLYASDTAFFAAHFEPVFQNPSVTIYRVAPPGTGGNTDNGQTSP